MADQQLLTRMRESLSRVNKLAADGASVTEVARALRIPEHVLTALASRYLTGRRHGSAAALDCAARALGVSPAQAMARILSAVFEGVGG